MMDHMLAQEFVASISLAQARYIHAIDDENCVGWPDFFVDDCFYQVTSVDNLNQNLPAGAIWLDSKTMLQDRITSLREANIYERHSYRHLIGQPYLKALSGNEAESETAFIVARITREGPTDLYATGRYLDRWRVDGADAKIISRIVALDSNRIDTLLGFPL